MNANELSDLLDKHTGGAGNIYQQAATMLRKQQIKIEALKKHNEELQKACVETLVWVMGNGGYCSLDIEVILKNVLGGEWEDYK
jgi:hypothetical protein